jgi:hypothetical protein
MKVFSSQKKSKICVHPKIPVDEPSVISTVTGGAVYSINMHVSNSVTTNYLSPNKNKLNVCARGGAGFVTIRTNLSSIQSTRNV